MPKRKVNFLAFQTAQNLSGGYPSWHLSPRRGFRSAAQLEAGGADRSYLRSGLGKRKKRDSGAYVASFNRVLAGLAVSDVLQLILGYAPAFPVRRQYDGLSGTVLEVVVEKNPNCPKCSSILAAGNPLWQ